MRIAKLLITGVTVGAFALLATSGALRAADQATIDAAKKEGKVVWYTGLVLTEAAKPLIEAFKAKYPGVDVEAARYAAPDIMLRVQNEAQAKNHVVDVVDGTAAIPAISAACACDASGIVVALPGSPCAGASTASQSR